MASTINVELGLSTWASTTVIIVSLCQCAFYYYQRTQKRCGWEVLYVAAVEPSTYLIGLVFGGNALIDLDGTPFNYMRYGGWLATCPVLLILLSNMPLSRKLKKPTDTLTLLILDQLMIVFGVGAIIYGGPAKVVLFLLGLMAGAGIFYIMYDVWGRCIQSYPEAAHKGVNTLFGLFFTSWTMFPLVWLLGPEGFGVIDISSSIILHAILDIVSKNVQSFVAWWVRWRLVPQRKHGIASLDITAEGNKSSKKAARAAAKAKAAAEAAEEALDDSDIKRQADEAGNAQPVPSSAASASGRNHGASAPRIGGGGAVADPLALTDGPADPALAAALGATSQADVAMDESALLGVVQRAMEHLQRDARRLRVRVLIVEPDPVRQRMMEDALERVNAEGNGVEVQADFLFRAKDFRFVAAKGRTKQYAAVMVNGEEVRRVTSMAKGDAKAAGLLVYSAAQAQRGFDGQEGAKGKAKPAGWKPSGRAESVSLDGSGADASDEDSEEPSSDEEEGEESDDGAVDSPAMRTRRLFGPLYVVGYRLKLPRELRGRTASAAGAAPADGSAGPKTSAHMSRREMAELGCRVFLRHPANPEYLGALVDRLADAKGTRREAEQSKKNACRVVATAAQATAKQRAAALLSRRAALEAHAASQLRGGRGHRGDHRDDDVASVLDVGYGEARVRREDSGLINLSNALFYDQGMGDDEEEEEEAAGAVAQGRPRSRGRRGSMGGGGRGRRSSAQGLVGALGGSSPGVVPPGRGAVDPRDIDLEGGGGGGVRREGSQLGMTGGGEGGGRSGRRSRRSKSRRGDGMGRGSSVGGMGAAFGGKDDEDSEAGGYSSSGRRSRRSGRSGSRRRDLPM